MPRTAAQPAKEPEPLDSLLEALAAFTRQWRKMGYWERKSRLDAIRQRYGADSAIAERMEGEME